MSGPASRVDQFSGQVYRALANCPLATIDDLAIVVEARGDRVATALAFLAGQGPVRQISDDLWAAQDPVAALAAIHSRREAELVTDQAAMATARAALYDTALFRDFMAGHRASAPAVGLVEAVIDEAEIASQIADILQQARHTVWWMLAGPPRDAGSHGIRSRLHAARARGLQTRGLWYFERRAPGTAVRQGSQFRSW